MRGFSEALAQSYFAKVTPKVAQAYGRTVEELLVRCNSPKDSRPRMVAYAVMRKLNVPWMTIGKLYGRHHSTIQHGVDVVSKNPKAKVVVQRILESL